MYHKGEKGTIFYIKTKPPHSDFAVGGVKLIQLKLVKTCHLDLLGILY